MFYFKHNRLEDGRFTLTRALQSLDKREVVETSVKFAQIEFKYGDSERGRPSRDGPDILIFLLPVPDLRSSKTPDVRPNMRLGLHKQRPKTYVYWKTQMCNRCSFFVLMNKTWTYEKCKDAFSPQKNSFLLLNKITRYPAFRLRRRNPTLTSWILFREKETF